MAEKTLYISDLDGTLLAPGACLTPKTADILNRLINAGGFFTAATARVLIGLKLLDLSGVNWNVPFVLGNGSMLYDMARRRVVETLDIPPDTIRRVLDICEAYGKTPLLYQVKGDDVLGVAAGVTSEGERAFMNKRNARFPGCIRIVPAYEPEEGGFYFSMQDTREKMEALAAALRQVPDIRTVVYRDVYMENNWFMEIFHAGAGKDVAMKALKERLGVTRVVAFGDNLNDLPMLKAADYACVVANGLPEAKAEADEVIGGNDEDGVAMAIARMEGLSC